MDAQETSSRPQGQVPGTAPGGAQKQSQIQSEARVTPGGSVRGEAADQLQLVTFEVGAEQFAIDILAVQEINRMMQITRVPQSPECLEGVINLRGRIIPVIDLRRRFGMQPSTRDAESRIVVVEVHARVLGFIVDRVNEVLRVDSTIVDAAPPMTTGVDRDFIRGVAKLPTGLVILLDIARLLAAQAGTCV